MLGWPLLTVWSVFQENRASNPATTSQRSTQDVVALSCGNACFCEGRRLLDRNVPIDPAIAAGKCGLGYCISRNATSPLEVQLDSDLGACYVRQWLNNLR
jgi:hypothetical protein